MVQASLMIVIMIVTYNCHLQLSFDCNMFIVQAPVFIQLANVCAIFPNALTMLTIDIFPWALWPLP